MSDEPRKASDILLSLEEKVNNLIKIVSVYDLNIKLVADRVNKIYSYIEEVKKSQEEPIQPENDDFKLYTQPEHIISISEEPIVTKRTPIPEVSRSEPDTTSEKKVPVSQRITDNTGKDVFMAEVSIFNSNKELVIKTKTNAVGKWQAYLKPGPYSIAIVKTDTATKKKIETLQEIVVPNSNVIFILPVAMIKR